MVKLYNTSLPLWYIVAIFVNILISGFTYIGNRYSGDVGDINLMLKFNLMNWLLIFVWLLVNVVMLIVLFAKKAVSKDYVAPVYYVVLHVFYGIMIVLGVLFQFYFPAAIMILIGTVSSAIEIILGIYLAACFFQTMKKVSDDNLKILEKSGELDSLKKITKERSSPKKNASKKAKRSSKK